MLHHGNFVFDATSFEVKLLSNLAPHSNRRSKVGIGEQHAIHSKVSDTGPGSGSLGGLSVGLGPWSRNHLTNSSSSKT
jgi:hypothetical protein